MQLAVDEKILWQGGPAWSNYLGMLILAFVLLAMGITLPFFMTKPAEMQKTAIGSQQQQRHDDFERTLEIASRHVPIGISLVLLLVVVVKRATQRYTVTSQRAVVRRGLLGRHEWELELRHVRDIQLKQSFGQRLLRTGTLEISSAGRDTAEVVFGGISDPDAVKDLVRQGMRQGPAAHE